MSILFSILTLYSWVLGAGLVLFVLHIARFYEKKYVELYRDAPRRRTYYQLFWIPLILFTLAAGRYALLRDDWAGDVIGDLAFAVAGVVLATLAYHVHNMMTGGRR
jgi:hypothetical protein